MLALERSTSDCLYFMTIRSLYYDTNGQCKDNVYAIHGRREILRCNNEYYFTVIHLLLLVTMK